MPATARHPAVNLVGDLGAADGAGQVVRQIGRALDAAGVAHADLAAERPGAAPHDASLLCLNPDRLPRLATRAGAELFAGRRSAGLWCWEADELAPGLAWAFDYVDEVWAYSDFVADALRPLSPVPVERFTMPVEPDPPAPAGREQLGLPDGFLFLYVFDSLSAARKNPLAAAVAFARAFPPGSGAKLALKTHNSARHPAGAAALREAAALHPDIQVIDRVVPEAEKNAMIAACDCYVSTHRSEGLGLTIAEAMFFGRPVIATGWSGSLELTDERNSYLLDYDLRPVGESWPYRPFGRWAEPRTDHAAALMATARENPEDARARGERAAADIRREHSAAAAGERLAERIEALAAGERRGADALPQSTSQRARRLVERGPEPSRRGGRHPLRALRALLLRALRPHTAHQREVDVEILEAVAELERRVEALERDREG